MKIHGSRAGMDGLIRRGRVSNREADKIGEVASSMSLLAAFRSFVSLSDLLAFQKPILQQSTI